MDIVGLSLPGVVGDEALRKWSVEHHDWCRAQWLGFDGRPFFGDYLAWATRHADRSSRLLQTFVFLESAFSETDIRDYGSVENAVWEKAEDAFRNFASLVVIDT